MDVVRYWWVWSRICTCISPHTFLSPPLTQPPPVSKSCLRPWYVCMLHYLPQVLRFMFEVVEVAGVLIIVVFMLFCFTLDDKLSFVLTYKFMLLKKFTGNHTYSLSLHLSSFNSLRNLRQNLTVDRELSL